MIRELYHGCSDQLGAGLGVVLCMLILFLDDIYEASLQVSFDFESFFHEVMDVLIPPMTKVESDVKLDLVLEE